MINAAAVERLTKENKELKEENIDLIKTHVLEIQDLKQEVERLKFENNKLRKLAFFELDSLKVEISKLKEENAKLKFFIKSTSARIAQQVVDDKEFLKAFKIF